MNALQATSTTNAWTTADSTRVTLRLATLSFVPNSDEQTEVPLGKSCYQIEVDKMRMRQRMFEVTQAQAAWSSARRSQSTAAVTA